MFVLALSVKYAYLHERLQLPDANYPIMDSLFHDQWARGLAFGEWTPDLAELKDKPYFRAPLYPYFLSAVYRVAGTSPQIVFAVQLLIGAVTVVLTFWFTSLLFGVRAAWIAALLHIGYWPITYHEAERLIPVLILPLNLLLLIGLVLAGRTGRLRFSGLAGLMAGLSAVARPSILIVVPIAAVWLWRRLSGDRRRHVLVFTAAVVAMVLPVTIRNITHGDLVPIAWQGGVNFYIGNNPASNGVTAVVPGTRADWWGGFDDTWRIAETESGRALRPSEVSRYWYRQGFAFVVSEPGSAARLYLRKLALLLGNPEPSNDRQLLFRRGQSRVLSLLPANFAMILATALFGILGFVGSGGTRGSTCRDSILPLLLAFAYATGVVAFFVTCRYRLPIVLFLIPAASYGVVRFWDLVRARRWKRIAPGLLIASLVAVLSMQNPFKIGGG